MNVSLQKIDKHNYEEVCDLNVTEEQENYLASNVNSLVESKFEDGLTTRCIVADDDLVGFLMWWQNPPADTVLICRFMVDQKFQQKGIGRKALEIAIDDIKAGENLNAIEICYSPENPVAKDFYASFGFEEIGFRGDEDDEHRDMIAVIKL